MNRTARSAAAVIILSLMSFACGGGGGGGGPTQPPAPAGKRLQFTVIAAPGNFEGGILEGAAFFDGQEAGRTDWSRSGPCDFNCAVQGDVQGISAGNHTLRFTVVRQERNLMLYQFILTGFVTDPASGSRVPIGNQVSERVRLRAGDSVTFNVSI